MREDDDAVPAPDEPVVARLAVAHAQLEGRWPDAVRFAGWVAWRLAERDGPTMAEAALLAAETALAVGDFGSWRRWSSAALLHAEARQDRSLGNLHLAQSQVRPSHASESLRAAEHHFEQARAFHQRVRAELNVAYDVLNLAHVERLKGQHGGAARCAGEPRRCSAATPHACRCSC